MKNHSTVKGTPASKLAFVLSHAQNSLYGLWSFFPQQESLGSLLPGARPSRLTQKGTHHGTHGYVSKWGTKVSFPQDHQRYPLFLTGIQEPPALQGSKNHLLGSSKAADVCTLFSRWPQLVSFQDLSSPHTQRQLKIPVAFLQSAPSLKHSHTRSSSSEVRIRGTLFSVVPPHCSRPHPPQLE